MDNRTYTDTCALQVVIAGVGAKDSPLSELIGYLPNSDCRYGGIARPMGMARPVDLYHAYVSGAMRECSYILLYIHTIIIILDRLVQQSACTHESHAIAQQGCVHTVIDSIVYALQCTTTNLSTAMDVCSTSWCFSIGEFSS